jgi:sodium-coupled monocarboxylate transporter 8/12
MGGVLQAALGLFGMIGGPTLGLFSLGMLYPWANRWGAWSGFITSLTLTLWLGLGNFAAKPPVAQKPYSNDQCFELYACPEETSWSYLNDTVTGSVTSSVTGLQNYSMWNDTSESPSSAASSEYTDLWFYKISYLYYATFAVLVCHSVGLIVSLITGLNKVEDVDPMLLATFVRDLYCCRSSQQQKDCSPDDSLDMIKKGGNSENDFIEISTVQPPTSYLNSALVPDDTNILPTASGSKFSSNGTVINTHL